MAATLFSAALDLLYPRSCAVCGLEVTADTGHVCWDCRCDFDTIGLPFCSQCGDPIEGRADLPFTCGGCRRQTPAFDRARSAVRYRGGIERCLWALKYRRAIHLASDLTTWLEGCVAAHLPDIVPDVVVPVPLHRTRLRERTYNQAELLARRLARRLGIEHFAGALRRKRPTVSQVGLNARQRRENMRGAFEAGAAEWIDGRRILLVDDVMTTGATVNAAAAVLKRAGARRVWVVTVARG